ncbi:carbohydrate ABC transporter permease [Patulibacter sp. SYSU D01012]|uniref:carbohydrate ABC transporter permease n=1 Tax=Patulibacter sp. SYSU D01012 TaxID=2817381 RepID=UPI001B31381A|nr:carbohydrate ABC transporter permease [Patulibacter sp. SYSU D01012]
MSTIAPAQPSNAAVERDRAPRRRKRQHSPVLWIGVVFVVLFCLFPFYWLVQISLRHGQDLGVAKLYPPNPTLQSYKDVFANDDFVAGLRNSVIVSTVTTLLSVLVGSFAAYALARLRFRGKFTILALILSVTTFPPIAIALPIFQLWTDIGLNNTLIGLVIPYLTFALPLTTYILTSFFREIPRDLEEAAMVDGATRFQAFRKVVVPLAAPGMATAGILTFIFAWNEYLLAITLTTTKAARTVPAAIGNFNDTAAGGYAQPIGLIAAASVIISIPLIVLVLAFQKRIVAGLTAGAVKG